MRPREVALPRYVRFARALALATGVGAASCSSASNDAPTSPSDATVETRGGDDAALWEVIAPDTRCDPDDGFALPPDAKRSCICPREHADDPEFADAGFDACVGCNELRVNTCYGVPGGPLPPPDLPNGSGDPRTLGGGALVV